MEVNAVLITASDLAKRLRVKTQTVKDWTRRGMIPSQNAASTATYREIEAKLDKLGI